MKYIHNKLKYSVLLILILFFSKNIFSQENPSFYKKLSDAALNRTSYHIIYDPSYFSLKYPNGDVPKEKGVCTDVVIRSYRKLGIDLQKEVHEDMIKNFSKYPKNWGLKHTDKNIDHRRVPNLMTFFSRHGKVLSKKKELSLYHNGDIVCWDLGRGITHIGIVVEVEKDNIKKKMIVHNIGAGPKLEDVLFDYTIIGHFQYYK